MGYLFSAYTIIFILIAFYIVVLDKRQRKINQELVLVEEMLQKMNKAEKMHD